MCRVKLTKLEKLNKKLSFEEQEKAMNYIADKANKRSFRDENIFEYILNIGIDRDCAIYLIECCLGFEYIENLLND